MLTQDQIEDIKEQLVGLSPEQQQKKLQEIISKLPEEDREQLVGKQQCPFCLMVEGKIPVRKVFEDDRVMAILDINPANIGHTLVFPKQHAKVFRELNENLVLHCFTIANKISTAISDGLKAEGTNIFVANGIVAGQTAPHALINVIPRFTDDKVQFGWNPKKADDKEMDRVLETVKAKIPKDKPVIDIKKSNMGIKDHQRIP